MSSILPYAVIKAVQTGMLNKVSFYPVLIPYNSGTGKLSVYDLLHATIIPAKFTPAIR